jgi:hypothetical protein
MKNKEQHQQTVTNSSMTLEREIEKKKNGSSNNSLLPVKEEVFDFSLLHSFEHNIL